MIIHSFQTLHDSPAQRERMVTLISSLLSIQIHKSQIMQILKNQEQTEFMKHTEDKHALKYNNIDGGSCCCLLFCVFPQGSGNRSFPPAGLVSGSMWSDRPGGDFCSFLLKGIRQHSEAQAYRDCPSVLKSNRLHCYLSSTTVCLYLKVTE